MSSAVLVPGTPLLLPGVGGSADPGRELRDAAVAAITDVIQHEVSNGSPSIVVLAAGAADRPWPDSPYPLSRLVGHVHPQPTAGGPGPPPLGVWIGRELVRQAGWDGPLPARSVHDHQETLAELGSADIWIMVADGSARRRSGGPDVPLQEARAFDDQLAAVIGSGDARGLSELCARTAPRAAELIIAGLPVWRLLGELAGQADRPAGLKADLRSQGDPFGVFGLVASWRW